MQLVCSTCRKHSPDDSDKSLLQRGVRHQRVRGMDAPVYDTNQDHNAGKDAQTIYTVFCSN